jgi:hypothetical protein
MIRTQSVRGINTRFMGGGSPLYASRNQPNPTGIRCASADQRLCRSAGVFTLSALTSHQAAKIIQQPRMIESRIVDMMNLHQAYRIPPGIQARLVAPTCRAKAWRRREHSKGAKPPGI